MLVGLTGYGRSGKDTVAAILVNDHGFTKFKFAGLVKECVWVLNPLLASGVRYQDFLNSLMADSMDEAVEVAKGHVGYGKECRELWQRMGTDVGRNLLGDKIWVTRTIEAAIKVPKAVIADLRFPNEGEAVRYAGGILWRVDRPGTGPLNGHASELEVANIDVDNVVHNDVEMADLAYVVADMLL